MFKKTVDAVYPIVNISTILDYVKHHRQILQRLLGYSVVCDKMKHHDHIEKPIVFELAQSMKNILDSPSYNKFNLQARLRFEKSIEYLPKSIKNLVFASQVCIKSLKENKYLHLNIKNMEIVHANLLADLSAGEGKWSVKLSSANEAIFQDKRTLNSGKGCLSMNTTENGNQYVYIQQKIEKKEPKVKQNQSSFLKELVDVFSGLAKGLEQVFFQLACTWIIEPKGELVSVYNVFYRLPSDNEDSSVNMVFCDDNDPLCDLWDIQDCGNSR